MNRELAASPPPPYVPPPAAASRPCPGCGSDTLRRPCDPVCPQRGEIHRVSLDAEGMRLEGILAAATRRAWRAWVKAGRAS